MQGGNTPCGIGVRGLDHSIYPETRGAERRGLVLLPPVSGGGETTFPRRSPAVETSRARREFNDQPGARDDCIGATEDRAGTLPFVRGVLRPGATRLPHRGVLRDRALPRYVVWQLPHGPLRPGHCSNGVESVIPGARVPTRVPKCTQRERCIIFHTRFVI